MLLKKETEAIVLPILPLKGSVAFPNLVIPLSAHEEDSIKMIDEALSKDKKIGLFPMKENMPEKEFDSLYTVGTLGIILKLLRFPDGSVRFLCQAKDRIKIIERVPHDNHFVAKAKLLEEIREPSDKEQALVRNIISQFKRASSISAYLPEDIQIATLNIEEPGRLSDMIAYHLNLSVKEKYDLLSELNVTYRLEKLNMYITKEMDILELTNKIQKRATSRLQKTQREYLLREQMKVIKEELGEQEEQTKEVEEFREKIESSGMSEEAKEAAVKELDRLSKMNPAAAEYTVARTYLDWLTSLPWKYMTKDNLDLQRAQVILDEDHYDLEKIKERIIEYLAVQKLKKQVKGPILCFVGPPGVGKTSLGKSIARGLGRKFHRISLGGMKDEAEIRGHRRTYVGALPGRIIQGIKKAGTLNPVFMLDEIDKIGQDFRGDPASALLEVLDPEQNYSFSDHYLDVSFDLSKVMFIGTANYTDPIPRVLLDRMEVIYLPGYTDHEKLHIAKNFLLPKVLEAHGISSKELSISDKAILKIINDYTRESGVRNLDRQLASCTRKVARKIAEGGKTSGYKINPGNLNKYLGAPRYFREKVATPQQPGVAIGLAWTETGGDVLFVEATKMPGNKNLVLTGHLGSVMKESAQTGLSYIRSKQKELKIDVDFSKIDIHIHVPAGAIPKDGPSAGVTITTALASLLTNTPIKQGLAMTGEITLRGEVMPVGGLKAKALAAHRSGIDTILLPKANEKDIEEIPEEITKNIKFVFIETMDDLLKKALVNHKKARKKS
ncbi:endopeptidase La [bacterium]|nr:endopeptidase La [bacterium]